MSLILEIFNFETCMEGVLLLTVYFLISDTSNQSAVLKLKIRCVFKPLCFECCCFLFFSIQTFFYKSIHFDW